MKENLFTRPWGVRLVVTIGMALLVSLLSIGPAHASPPEIIKNDRCGTGLDNYTPAPGSQWAYRYEGTDTYIGAYGTPIPTNGALEIRLIAGSFADRTEVLIVLSFTGSGQVCIEAADTVTFTVGSCIGNRGHREVLVHYTNVTDASGLPKDRLFVSATSNSVGTRYWNASGMGLLQDGLTHTIHVHNSQVDIMNQMVGYYAGIYRVDVFANGNMATAAATGVVSVPGCSPSFPNEDSGPPGAEVGDPKATLKWLKRGKMLKVTFDTPQTDLGYMLYKVIVKQGSKSLVKRFKIQAGNRGEVRRLKITRFASNRPRKAVVSVKSPSGDKTLSRLTYRVAR